MGDLVRGRNAELMYNRHREAIRKHFEQFLGAKITDLQQGEHQWGGLVSQVDANTDSLSAKIKEEAANRTSFADYWKIIVTSVGELNFSDMIVLAEHKDAESFNDEEGVPIPEKVIEFLRGQTIRGIRIDRNWSSNFMGTELAVELHLSNGLIIMLEEWDQFDSDNAIFMGTEMEGRSGIRVSTEAKEIEEDSEVQFDASDEGDVEKFKEEFAKGFKIEMMRQLEQKASGIAIGEFNYREGKE
jgi:hypothetical protein